MKQLLTIVFIGLVFGGCNSNDAEVEELKKELEELKSQKTQVSKEEESEGDFVYFKDGKKLDKSNFVKSCINSGDSLNLIKLIDIEEYCNCLIEKISQNFTSNEAKFLFENVLKSNVNKWKKAQELYNSPKIAELAEGCITSNIKNVKDNIDINSSNQLEVLIDEYKKTIKSELSIDRWEEVCNVIDIDIYCECMVIGLVEEFSYKEMIEDPQIYESPQYIYLDEICAQKALK